MATVLSDPTFLHLAYKASQRRELLAGFDEFLGLVTVIPPGAWDPSIRIEPPDIESALQDRNNAKWGKGSSDDEDEVRR